MVGPAPCPLTACLRKLFACDEGEREKPSGVWRGGSRSSYTRATVPQIHHQRLLTQPQDGAVDAFPAGRVARCHVTMTRVVALGRKNAGRTIEQHAEKDVD
ncbi:hypothetical protein BaRGS_00027394 [Batillaria attramentaria]|uniref:Uncharacterized protein n=1 Tax=Batillaria attramentaria TaxID=370345 RepID=A0ABD0K2A3_9CAEN